MSESNRGDLPEGLLRPWTNGRAIRSMGTNHGAPALAFQHWHRFKEAYAPEVVEAAVQASSREVRTILDPFGGSGTTALAAQFMGIHPVTMEVSPYLADVIESKLTDYDVSSLETDAALVLAHADRVRAATTHDRTVSRFVPQTFIEPGVKSRWIFSQEVFDFIESMRLYIDSIDDKRHRLLFRVLLGGCLVDLSNVVVSGKGRRYRRNWHAQQPSRDRAVEIFKKAISIAVSDVILHSSRVGKTFEVFRGSCLAYPGGAPKFDLAVFSPPYPNSFDYTDVYNLELWALGYLSSRQENKDLRLATLSSHVQVNRDYAKPSEGIERLDSLLVDLESIKDDLWNRHIPQMVGAYFQEMRVLLKNLRHSGEPGAQVWMVVGDSQYRGIVVPTAAILSDIGEAEGFAVIESRPLRLMNVAPQQGGLRTLPESVLVLKVPDSAGQDDLLHREQLARSD